MIRVLRYRLLAFLYAHNGHRVELSQDGGWDDRIYEWDPDAMKLKS